MNKFTGVHKVNTISPLENENGNIINSMKEKLQVFIPEKAGGHDGITLNEAL